MTSPKYKRMRTGLKCNKCGHGFEGLARHVAIQSSDRGVIGWVVDYASPLRSRLAGHEGKGRHADRFLRSIERGLAPRWTLPASKTR